MTYEMIGKKFHKLLVYEKQQKGYKIKWLCKCDCGNTTLADGYKLRTGHTRSCGCLKKTIGDLFRKHGFARKGNRTYSVWSHMKGRCENPNNAAYENYGGRGIRVCDEWKNNFESFLIDMGEKPKGLTLERIDNNGPYSAANCFWADMTVQARNRRSTKLTFADAIEIMKLHLRGEKRNDIAAKYGIDRSTVRQIFLGRTWIGAIPLAKLEIMYEKRKNKE